MKVDLSPKQRKRLAVEADALRAERDRGLAIGAEWGGDEASLKEILAFDESSSVPTEIVWRHGGGSDSFREGFVASVLSLRESLLEQRCCL